MKAAIFHGPVGSWPATPLSIEDVPMPTVAADEVLIRTAGAGLCRTDLQYLKLGVRLQRPPPVILGHELSGTVVEVGKAVTNFRPNDRVIAAYLAPCGGCAPCRAGRENLCDATALLGGTRDGAFAEFASVPAKSLCRLPEGIPLAEASIITDAVASSYHGLVNVARVAPEDCVAIYGASGGLGLCAVQIAKALGSRVIAIGRQPWKLERAREAGADEILSTAGIDDVAAAVGKITDGGATVSFDVSGDPKLIEAAIRATRPGGRIVLLAFNFHKVQFRIGRLMWMEHSILGSRNYRPRDLPDIVELVGAGAIKLDLVVSHRFPLEEINRAYDLLDRGQMLRGIVTF